MEKFCTLGCLWDQSLSLANVSDNDSTNIVVKLFSCELELIVGAELISSSLGQFSNLLLTLLHFDSFELFIHFLFSLFTGSVGCISSIADCIYLLSLLCIFDAFVDALRLRTV